ncbi:zinc finger domain-containing protein [Curtobacterium herbarum]|nr:hypothetical protein [Curtobacterium herbarum]MBM7474366.1 hypothetical protein [Curtobacterium herbarum]MCS6545752.1 hypothetical protein [Curtobacterium herbarum]
MQIPTDAMGYVFRTDSVDGGWSYIGQSTRLDRAHVSHYFGSGDFIRQVLEREGSSGLTKRILATATDQLELHYLEMLSIAEARRDGDQLLNGDFGGPRPSEVMQRALRQFAPEVMLAAGDPKRFHSGLLKHRELVEQAIIEAGTASDEEFYAGLERDLLATQDLSHPCPACLSTVGEVCRTNSRSLTAPHRPSRNHAKRPIQAV